MPDYMTVARMSDVPPGTGTVVSVKGHAIALFNVMGQFYALDNRCPHDHYPLGKSPVFDNLVICIGHCWRFDVRTGECYSVPGIFAHTYPLVVEGDEVKIRDDAIRGEEIPHL